MRTWLVVTALVVGCGSSSDKSAPAEDRCQFAGHYRLLFQARVGQQLWFRFRLSDRMRAVMTQPIALDIDSRTLTVKTDPRTCALDVVAKTPSGDLVAALKLDPATGKVEGHLRRPGTDVRYELAGVRDRDKPKSKLWCVKPGVYELIVPNEQAWHSTNQNESCDKAQLNLPFLVEYVGDRLVLDQLDDKGDAAWAAEDIVETAPCEVRVRFRHHDSWVTANLTFAEDKVTADGLIAEVEIEEAGGRWRCIADEPMLWVQKRAGDPAAKQ